MFASCVVCHRFVTARPWLCDSCIELLIYTSGLFSTDLKSFSKLWQRFQCLGAFQGPLAQLILQAKAQPDLAVLDSLARLFVAHIRRNYWSQEAVVMPVPMSRRRLLTRGFNQAAEIAKLLSRQLCLDYREDIIVHTGHSRVQHYLSKVERLKNMQHTFLARKGAPQSVCLVDDVFTTGATVSAVAKQLKRAGCQHIEIWIIAKTL